MKIILQIFNEKKQISKGLYLLLLFLLFLFSSRNLKNNDVSISGDWYEYLIMTCSFINHHSPDIRLEDVELSKEIIKLSGFNDLMSDYISLLKEKIQLNDPLKIRETAVFFMAHNGKTYNYHFWFYSLIATPFVKLFLIFNLSPLKAFMLLNTILLWLSLFIIYKAKLLDTSKKIILSFCVYFSSTIWYTNWIHPEVFLGSLILCSILFLYEGKYHYALLLCSIAALQNQVLALMGFIIMIDYIAKHKFNIPQIIVLGVIWGLVLIPSLFYYYNFGKTSLIIDLGFLDKSNINIHRLFSLFFDINQGTFLNIPILIFIFPCVFILKLYNKTFDNKTISIPFVLLTICLVVIQQINWNMGEAVIIRYGIWISMIILAYTIIEINTHCKRKVIIFIAIALSQIAVIITFGGHNCQQSYTEHNAIAKYILNNYPQLYNPDIDIFAKRTLNKTIYTKSDSPIIYRDANEKMKKVLLHKDTPANNKNKIVLPQNLKFKEDWSYINY